MIMDLSVNIEKMAMPLKGTHRFNAIVSITSTTLFKETENNILKHIWN